MAFESGARIGRYAILDLVGRGGMGEVYRAHDDRLGRDVAIKVLPAAVSRDADRLRRFEQEARAAAALNHPNILAVYDVGAHDGAPYVVSELLHGATLRQALAGGALALRKAIDLATQIAGGLAAAHDAGVVHRDLKPENIFVTRDGRAKILDFGLAKLVEPRPAADGATIGATRIADSVAGLVVGTVGYMSPEQARGTPVDHRSDIFSYGTILYEMLSGERAFKGATTADLLSAVLTAEPAPLTAVNHVVPAALDTIVQHSLEKDPAARFQSTRDLLFALRSLATPSSTASIPADAGASEAHAIVERGFRLTETVCRKLDRASLDARLIGDQLHYLDNGAASGVVVCYLHGMGLDGRQFEPILRTSRYRGFAPTMYGFDPGMRSRLRLSLDDHASILREWLREVIVPLGAEQIVLVGFSAGADLWMQMIASDASDAAVHPAGLLTLDCNVTFDTAFVSRVLARLPSDDPQQLVTGLRVFGEDPRSLDEWLNTHEYLVKVFRKFRADLGALTGVAREVIRPFEGTGLETFVSRYRAVSRAVPALRLVFSDLEANHRVVAQARLLNLDTGALGDRYCEDTIVVESGADHFDLLDTDRMVRHIDALVQQLRR